MFSVSNLISSNNLQEIREHLLPVESKVKPLVLLDFDDTLVRSGSEEAAHLGGVKWRGDFRKLLSELQKTNAITTNAPLFECLTLLIAKSLTARAVQDNQTAELITQLENMGCKIMILTARGISGENAWYKLTISGVESLTKNQMEQAGIAIKPDSTRPAHPNVFENIIFAQNKPKDQILNDLFTKEVLNASETSQILFIDDKKDAVESVSSAASKLEIPYIGIHYTRVEEIEKLEYHLLKSTIQLVSLLANQILLNQEDLAEKYAKIEKQGITPEEFFKKILIQLDQALLKGNVYEQMSLDTDQLFEKIKHAVSGHFNEV